MTSFYLLHILWPLSGHGSMWRTAYYDIARPSLTLYIFVTAYITHSDHIWPWRALLPIFRLTQPPLVVLHRRNFQRSGGGSGRRIFSQSRFSDVEQRPESRASGDALWWKLNKTQSNPVWWSASDFLVIRIIWVSNKQTNKQRNKHKKKQTSV